MFFEKIKLLIELFENGILTEEKMFEAVTNLSQDIEEYDGWVPSCRGLHFKLIYRNGVLGYAVSQKVCDAPLCKECNVEYIEIPQTYRKLPVICIAEHGFNDPAIKEVNLPISIQYIDDFAFQGTYIEKISLYDSLKQIGFGIFSSCLALKEIKYWGRYSSWLEIEKSAKWNDKTFPLSLDCYDKKAIIAVVNTPIEVSPYSRGLSYEFRDGGAWVSGIGSCNDEHLLIPARLEDGTIVIGIQDRAFENCQTIISVDIPKGVKIIGGRTFADCSNLKTVKLRHGLEEIWGFAFEDCTSLTSIEIPSSVINIGNTPIENLSPDERLLRAIFGEKHRPPSGNPFKGCTKLRSIKVNTKNEFYYDYIHCLIETKSKKVVSGCKASVLPDDCETIGAFAFWGCKGAFKYGLPSYKEYRIKVIETGAFAHCTDMQEFALPNTLTHIESEAFEGCSSLNEITFPASLVDIGSSAFEGCAKLKKIQIPTTVGSIGMCAFKNCQNLVAITYDEQSPITSVEFGTFEGCTNLIDVALPGKLEKIESYAFKECQNLPNISLPNTLKLIEERAFASCGRLRGFFIPRSVEQVGADVFIDCWPYLDEIECETQNKNPAGWDTDWNRKREYGSYHEVIWGANKE